MHKELPDISYKEKPSSLFLRVFVEIKNTIKKEIREFIKIALQPDLSHISINKLIEAVEKGMLMDSNKGKIGNIDIHFDTQDTSIMGIPKYEITFQCYQSPLLGAPAKNLRIVWTIKKDNEEILVRYDVEGIKPSFNGEKMRKATGKILKIFKLEELL